MMHFVRTFSNMCAYCRRNSKLIVKIVLLNNIFENGCREGGKSPWIRPCHKPKKIENHWSTSSEILINKTLEGVNFLASSGTDNGYM